ncbi:19952_t:CDS:1, partial [Racocetra persica]
LPIHEKSTRELITQPTDETTVVFTKYDKVNDKSLDVYTINAEYSSLKMLELDFPDIQMPTLNFSGVQLPKFNFSDVQMPVKIVIIIIIGIVVIIASYFLILGCAYCLGFGPVGIIAGSIVAICQSIGATGAPGPCLIVLVA